MDQNPDVIRHNIEETRSALTDKLETLEHEVFGTVREATQAVSDTVENVKETVACTVENVKEKVEAMAIGVTAGLLRDAVRARVPDAMVADFEELANNITSKIGGEPVHGPVLESAYGQPTSSTRSL